MLPATHQLCLEECTDYSETSKRTECCMPTTLCIPDTCFADLTLSLALYIYIYYVCMCSLCVLGLFVVSEYPAGHSREWN